MGIRVRILIADAPKRAEVRCLQGHAAYYACDYCEAKAVCIKNKGETGSKRVWPSSVLPARQRTHDDMLRRANESSRRQPGANAGVTGRSALFDLDNFDVVKDIIVDPMHHLHEGLVKAILS